MLSFCEATMKISFLLNTSIKDKSTKYTGHEDGL